MTKKIKVLLLLIVLLALGLRVYKLDSVPPSISWDEAANGYNGWTIANYGKDEYGKSFPLFFRSFGDDKHPVHIYATAISVKLLGLNEFATRLSSAIFGVLNVLLIFYLAKVLFPQERTSSFKNNFVALAASLFLAISPYNIHFSRFNHEANFALFFFMLGIFLFFLSIKSHKRFLPFSVLSLGICFLAYHPSKVVVPILVVTSLLLYYKKLILIKREFLYSFLVGVPFLIVVFLNPQLLGLARINQNTLNLEEAKKTTLFKQTNNEFLGKLNLIAIQYSWHFIPKYLFISGDKNPRLSSQTGEFYKLDALFLVLGVLFLIFKRSKESVFLMVWALIAPLPSASVAEAPHAARAMFMMGSWHIVAALGFYLLINLARKLFLKWAVVIICTAVLVTSLASYLSYYYGEYARRYAIEWQYGMKQIVEFVKQHEEYSQVFVTDIRSQPYIFFLYYLETPLPDYLHTLIYNNNLDNRSYNNVASFDKFAFGGWDPIESLPKRGILYIITPSQYDGLRYKLAFDVKKLIKYPDGTDAFYLVSSK